MTIWQGMALGSGLVLLLGMAAASGALLKAWNEPDAGKSKPRLVIMVLWVLVFTLLGTAMSWRAAHVTAKPHLPQREIVAELKAGRWVFSMGSRHSTNLDLIAGQPVQLNLRAQDPGEFFVPSLGLRKRLEAGEESSMLFRPAAPPPGQGMAVHRSICNYRCREAEPFLIFVRDELDSIAAY